MILYIMLIVAYLVGSLSFAIIISKLMKIDDPRSYGSQNAGATNVMRSGNKKAAGLTLVGDLLKGLLVVVVARFVTHGIDGGDAIVGICGVMVVIGHIYPIFFKFKGGKGVATAIGVLLGFHPVLALLIAITWFIVFKVSHISSLSAILATLISPLYAYFLMGNSSYFGATTIIAFFIIYKHKANIIRLVRGTEGGFKKDPLSNEEIKNKPQETEVWEVVGQNSVIEEVLAPSASSASENANCQNYYDLLAVSRNASFDEIKIAYRILSLNLQPEDEALPAYNDGAIDNQAVDKAFHKIKEAYTTLSDPLQREMYDKILNQQLADKSSND